MIIFYDTKVQTRVKKLTLQAVEHFKTIMENLHHEFLKISSMQNLSCLFLQSYSISARHTIMGLSVETKGLVLTAGTKFFVSTNGSTPVSKLPEGENNCLPPFVKNDNFSNKKYNKLKK